MICWIDQINIANHNADLLVGSPILLGCYSVAETLKDKISKVAQATVLKKQYTEFTRVCLPIGNATVSSFSSCLSMAKHFIRMLFCF